MVTIQQLKDMAEQNVTQAKAVAKTVHTIVVVEDSVLSRLFLKDLADANGRSHAAKIILRIIESERATSLDEATTELLLRRFRAEFRSLIDCKEHEESIRVMYDFVTTLEEVQGEREYES